MRISQGISLLLALAFCARAAHAEVPFIGDKCKPAEDQFATFGAPVQKLPIPVTIDQAFTSGQRSNLLAAVTEWNRFATEKLGIPLFMVMAKSSPDYSSLAVGARYCKIDAAKRPDGLLVLRVDSNSAWSDLELSETAGAVQYRCELGLKDKVSLLMMMNTTYTTYDLLRAVALHELGHALGLRHSCSPSSDSRFYRGCKAVRKDHPYRLAVMAPSLDGTSMREVDDKKSLQPNDLERAYCLYQKYPFD